MLIELAWAWIAVASLTDFTLAGWDKRQARRGRGRVKESVLLGLAFAGGSPGLVLGMLAFRHKTRKGSFLAVVLLILAAQGAAAWLLLR